MGRSENSRNRVYGNAPDGRVFTEAADPAKVKDPSLIIYNAMAETEGLFVVSNGDQTDTVVKHTLAISDFYEVMDAREYEPDQPNYTPRITGICSFSRKGPQAILSILRKSAWNKTCDRHFYSFDEIEKGFGLCLTTYSGDGDPLPAFHGEPYLLPLRGSIEEVSATLWDALNPENRVALAIKYISPSGKSKVHITNKFSKV